MAIPRLALTAPRKSNAGSEGVAALIAPLKVRGAYLYLYLIMDVWSRRIVGWRIAQRESAEVAAQLIAQSCAAPAARKKVIDLGDGNTTVSIGSCGIMSDDPINLTVPLPAATDAAHDQ
jgi:hypothetical protein